MNGICGIVFLGPKKIKSFQENQLIEELKKRGSNLDKYEDSHNFSYTASHKKEKYIFSNINYFINFSGRIDNREDFIKDLKLNINISNAELIVTAFHKMGKEIFNELIGAFAFFIFDKRRKEFFAVRDHLGMKPFYYSFKDGFFVYGSEPKFIFQISKEKKILNNEKLFNSLLRNDENFEHTFYKEIFRLERGKFIKSFQNKIEKFQYHKFETPSYIEYENEEDCFLDFNNLFSKIIAEQTANIEKIGTALSGGLDSTSVTRVLAEQNKKNGNKKKIFSYSFKFSNLETKHIKTTDEMSYVEDAISLGGLNPRIIDIPRGDYVMQLINDQKIFPSPNLQGNRYLELFTIKNCIKDGVDTLLTGFDGDCTVSYGMEYIQILLRQFRIMEALKLNNLTRKNLNLPGNSFRTLFNYVFLRLLPSKVHFFLRKAKGFNNLETHFKYFNTNAKNEINPLKIHQKRRKDMYDIKNSHRDLLNKKSFQNAFESLDIDYSYNGIEERHPFFDKRLMEFCLKIHPSLKLKNGFSRYILRESCKEVLPTSVKERMTKSDLSPYFYYSAKSNINILLENLLSSSSNLKDLLDEISLKKILSDQSKLTRHDISWIVNLNIHDQWIKQHIRS